MWIYKAAVQGNNDNTNERVCVCLEKRLCGQPRQLRAFVRLVLISSVFKQQVKYGRTLPFLDRVQGVASLGFEIEMDSKMKKKKKMKKRRMTVAGTKTHQRKEKWRNVRRPTPRRKSA